MADIKPLVDDSGEVRELTADDLATFGRGAPFAKGGIAAAADHLQDAITELERLHGAAREAVEPEIEHLRATRTSLTRHAAKA